MTFNSTESVPAWIGVGANIGDQAATINRAAAFIHSFPETAVHTASSFFDTAPIGPKQPRFLNAVIGIRTQLTPSNLLERLLDVERLLGRDRAASERWGPRVVDLDVLFYGDAVINEDGIAVPHPRLHERHFVLAPLASCAPDLMHPVLGQSMATLLRELEDRDDSLKQLQSQVTWNDAAAIRFL